MPLQVDWSGVYPAVPTQFNDDFSLDIPTTRQHIESSLLPWLVLVGRNHIRAGADQTHLAPEDIK